MALSEIIGVIGTLVGTTLGSAIGYLSARKSAEEASKRLKNQRANDNLEELYHSIVDCRKAFKDALSHKPSTVGEQLERIRKPFNRFEAAADRASLYLSTEERETLNNAAEEFNEVRMYLYSWAENRDEDRPDCEVFREYEKTGDELDDVAAPVLEMIRGELDPNYDEYQ